MSIQGDDKDKPKPEPDGRDTTKLTQHEIQELLDKSQGDQEPVDDDDGDDEE